MSLKYYAVIFPLLAIIETINLSHATKASDFGYTVNYDEEQWGTSTYYMSEDPATWTVGFLACGDMDANLIAIETEDESQFLWRWMIESETTDIWTGGAFDPPTTSYLWTGTGDPVDIEGWDRNNVWQPGHPIIVNAAGYRVSIKNTIFSTDKTWSTQLSSASYKYICEKASSPTTTEDSDVTDDATASTTPLETIETDETSAVPTEDTTVTSDTTGTVDTTPNDGTTDTDDTESTTTSSTTTILPTITPAATTTTIPTSTQDPYAWACPADHTGPIAHPVNCAMYYDCASGLPPALRTCTNGLYYNPAREACDFPYTVPECQNSGTRPPHTPTPLPYLRYNLNLF